MAAEVAWLSALIIVPLFVLPDAPHPFIVPRMYVLCAAGLICTFAGIRWRHDADRAAFLLLATIALATGLSVNPLVSVLGDPGRARGLITFASCIAIYFALRSADNNARERAIGAIVAVGFLAAIWALPIAYADPLKRVAGTLGNPIFLGAYLLPPALIAVHYARAQWLLWPIAGLLASSLVLTRSRGPILALAVGMVLLFRGSWWRLALVAAAIGGTAFWVIGMRGRWGVAERLDIWRISLNWFAALPSARWLVGVGPDAYETTWPGHTGARLESAHSVPLQMLITTGIVGFLAWCNLWGSVLASRLRYRWSMPVIAALTVESLTGIATTTSLLMLFVIAGLSVQP